MSMEGKYTWLDFDPFWGIGYDPPIFVFALLAWNIVSI